MKLHQAFILIIVVILFALAGGHHLASERLAAPKLTIVWGDDFAKAHPELFTAWGGVPKHFNFVRIGQGGPNYEFGLRSDGVVVWREIK